MMHKKACMPTDVLCRTYVQLYVRWGRLECTTLPIVHGIGLGLAVPLRSAEAWAAAHRYLRWVGLVFLPPEAQQLVQTLLQKNLN